MLGKSWVLDGGATVLVNRGMEDSDLWITQSRVSTMLGSAETETAVQFPTDLSWTASGITV
jgi:hypothetical protein